MPLAAGTRLGPYEILAPIGAGGMGEVYRAKDTKLGRNVAVKVLPESFAHDPERMARFEREAQVLASLNHPHIATIHGLEESNDARALIMELVEGPTLAERIGGQPMPLEDALPIAKQIADGLEYAHERGIIHRDLKPANVKLTADGNVKILDFGLAKALDAPTPQGNPSISPTLTLEGTRAGVILGSAAYMAPEQARGAIVDKRADVWAFGVVLYEMLTGKQPFAGPTVSDTLAAVLKTDPDWELVPAEMRRIVRRCLAKDPRLRLRDIGEARIALNETTGPEGVPQSAPKRVLPWAVAALFALIAVGALTLFSRGTQPESQMPVRLSIEPPEGTSFPFGAALGGQAISPDGRTLAFVAAQQGKPVMYVRSLDSLTARPLAGTEGAKRPFWSPDSRSIGFFAGGKLMRVDSGGGDPQVICEAQVSNYPGAWSPEGVILFSNGGAVLRVPASGGVPAAVTSLDSSRDEWAHYPSQFLPDGKHFLYFARNIKSFLQGTIYVGSLDNARGAQGLRIADLAYGAGFAAIPGQTRKGFLLFIRGSALMAQPFDAQTFALHGDPEIVADNLRLEPAFRMSDFSLSRTGVLVYGSGLPLRLTWRDRDGTVLSGSGQTGDYPRLSRDGKRVAFQRFDGRAGIYDVWFADSSGARETRLTSGDTRLAIWSPDGRDILYGAVGRGLLRQRAGGVGEESLISTEQLVWPTDWSPDGSHVLFVQITPPENGADLWVLPLGAGQKPFPFRKTTATEWRGHFSPDGHWVAYITNETGGYQVIVQNFPQGNGRRQISTDGGLYMIGWRRDGKELYYGTDSGDVMVVRVESSANDFRFEAPKRLFTLSQGSHGDVTADGQRFIFAEPGEKQTSLPLTVVLNWLQGLKW